MDTGIHESAPNAQFCCIWMHGLGSNNDDMLGLSRQLHTNTPIKHVSLNAAIRPVTINNNMRMRAWYDIKGADLTDREDEVGILASERQIIESIETEHANGFEYNKIFLAGFSQGGAMALFSALRFKEKLAGVISLSSYIPLVDKCFNNHKDLPVFMAYGKFDTVVYPTWTMQTRQWLVAQGMHDIETKEYPIAHSVSIAEISDLSKWLDLKAQHIIKSGEGA